MNNSADHLEVLTPGIKFFETRESRLSNLAAQASAIGSMFLHKRERLDSNDFTEASIRRNRGISDVILPDYKVVLDGHYERMRRRSSVLMMKDLAVVTGEGLEGEEDKDKDKAPEEETKAEEKAESRKRRDNEGFDFVMTKNRRKKDTKFVIKVNNDNEDLKINERTKGSKKKVSEEDDRQSQHSFIKADNVDDENDNENKPPGFVDEKQRLKTKISKVNIYWDKRSLYIPNVFRLARLIDDDAKNLLEFQDYSKKSVLVQGQGQSHKKSSDEQISEQIEADDLDECITYTQRRSFYMVLDHPEDILAFL